MEHDTGSGGRNDAKNSLILEELGFFDPVETMDDMFCNANMMKGLDFNTPDNNPQFDELFQDSGDGDSVDKSENSQDFAVGEMFDNISLLWSVDELLCGDDEEHVASDGQQACFEIEDREFSHLLSSDTNAGERIEGNTLLNCEKEDQDISSQNEISEANSVEPSDLNIEKKLESISLAGPVNDRELGFNEVMVKETTTIEGSCGSSDETPTEVKVEPEISPFKEIEEGEIVDYSQDGIASCSEDEYDDEEIVFRTIEGPIRSKNEVKVLPAVSPVNIILEEHHHTIPVGNIFSVIGLQILVEGLENHCPLNEGSVLWITNTRSALGVVDEIFGPVKNPYYVVRYNSEDQVPSGINVGDLVSYIPEFVNHILNENTLRQKGYDASGENDEEVSDEEFSDDEKEEEQKRKTRIMKRAAGACIDSRNRRNGRPPRPRTVSVARIRRSHFIRNPNQSSPSFPPSSSNNGCPRPTSVATPSPPSTHGPVPVPVSPYFPPAQCQISPAQIPLNPPQEMPLPFFFQAQTQAPQTTKVTHLQPSPFQVMAPPFSQWDYTQVMTLPLLNPCPNQQAVQSQPQVQPGQQHQNGMVHTQPTNLPFFHSRAPVHQMSPANAQMATVWGSTFQNFQPATVFGMAFPPANVDQNLLQNSQISQPALLNYHMANNPPPGMTLSQQCIHPSPSTMPTSQPYMSPAHPYMSPAQPCISQANPNMPPTQQNMPPTQPNMHSGQPTTPSAQPSMPSAQPSMPSAQPNLILAQPCMSPAHPTMPSAQPSMILAQQIMHPAQPYMPSAQPYMPPAQPCMSPAQLCMSPAQPCMSPAQPCMSPAQPCMSPAQQNMHLAQPSIPLAQKNMNLTQPNMPPTQPTQPIMFPAQPSLILGQPYMLPAQPYMSPAQPYMLPAQPCMSPAQPCMSPAQPCMSPAQPYMSTPQTNMHPVQQNIPPSMHSGQSTMPPSQQSMPFAQQSMPFAQQSMPLAQQSMPSTHQSIPSAHQSIPSAQPRMHLGQPSMSPAHPNTHMGQSSISPANPNMHVGQPSMSPANQNMHMGQPSMSPAHPNMHMGQPSMSPANSNMNSAPPGMHPGQPTINISQPSIQPGQPNMNLTQAPCFALPNTPGMAFQTWQTATTASSPTPQNLQQQPVWPFPANVPG